MNIRYVYSSEEVDYYSADNLEEAESEAEATLEDCRDNSGDGWPEFTGSICAGVLVLSLTVEERITARRIDYPSDEAWEEAGFRKDFDEYMQYDLKPVNAGLLAIIEERQRQIAKGWTPAHDAEHVNGEIIGAALVKLSVFTFGPESAREILGDQWPWGEPFGGDTSDPRKLLVEAAALIAAELDRLAAAAGGAG